MRDKSKKILSIVAAATMLSTAFAFGGCGDYYTNDTTLSGVNAADAVSSNGGFVVEKGDYVYFINGVENYTADNTFGEAVKGSLMRKKKADVLNGEVKAETVVPSLFVAQNFNAGIFIYEDKVYYATPTTDKSIEDGTVQNSWIDFKSAKLDGSATMKDYYFRLENNASNYRFVEDNGVVYCLFEEDGALKSFNTETEETTTLVKGAEGSFYYDMNDLTNPVVYYTMAVTVNADSDAPSTLKYNQLYQVSASATVASVDKDNASYTTSAGYTYSFNKTFMEEKNAEAKDNKTDEPYQFDDYTTYPYVNLGTLALDGIGSLSTGHGFETQYNPDKGTTAETANGYKYTIVSYASYGEGASKVSGVYFTRADAEGGVYDVDKSLYFLDDAKVSASDWNTVSGNKTSNFTKVASNTTNTANAIFYVDGSNHNYIYVDATSNKLTKMENGAEVVMATGVTGATMLKLSGDYLYYTTGTDLSRINYKGNADAYHPILENEEYKITTIPYVTWNSNWYKPEIIGDTLFYCNGDTVNGASYNYVYAAGLTNLAADVEAYETAMDDLDELADGDSKLLTALKYNFKTGETSAFDAVKDNGEEDEGYTQEQKDAFKAYAEDTAKVRMSKFITLMGKVNDADADAMQAGWESSLNLITQTEEEAEEEFPTWAIVLIVVGSVLVVGGVVAVVLVVLNKKKKQAEKNEKIANAFKNKIDTTDDKSIDVYADDEVEETPAEEAAETTEEVVEEAVEAVEEATEEVVEVPAETVVEEAPVEQPTEETTAETTEETTQE